MDILSICSGVCGLELGLRLVEDTRTVCYVENDAYCQRVIRQRIKDGLLDDAPIWDDLTTFDGCPWRGLVDAITAGFPCQPWSVAGQRKGVEDERNLWPDLARVIGEVRPPVVFLENTPGILPYVYYEVRPRLQEMGYRVTEGIFSAAEVGAPHERQRLFILAHHNSRGQRDELSERTQARDAPRPEPTQGSQDVAHARSRGRRGRAHVEGQGQAGRDGAGPLDLPENCERPWGRNARRKHGRAGDDIFVLYPH